MEIIDNFLDQYEFNELQKLIIPQPYKEFGQELPRDSAHFAWYYSDTIEYKENTPDRFQFVHMFYIEDQPNSSLYNNLNPIINKLEPKSIIRIKANLLTRTPEIIQNAFHIDLNDGNSENDYSKFCTTSIFYVNTNNGYTEFEDGTIVESVANRMVSFPANTPHTGTSCTDENIRVVINFNYFK